MTLLYGPHIAKSIWPDEESSVSMRPGVLTTRYRHAGFGCEPKQP